MITLEGNRSLKGVLPEAFEKLSSPAFLLTCIGPLLESSADENAATFKARPSLGIVSGIVEGTLNLLQKQPYEKLNLVQKIQGSGFSARAVVDLKFRPLDSGFAIDWTAELPEATGLLRMVPKSMLRVAMQKAIEDIWLEVESKLA